MIHVQRTYSIYIQPIQRGPETHDVGSCLQALDHFMPPSISDSVTYRNAVYGIAAQVLSIITQPQPPFSLLIQIREEVFQNETAEVYDMLVTYFNTMLVREGTSDGILIA